LVDGSTPAFHSSWSAAAGPLPLAEGPYPENAIVLHEDRLRGNPPVARSRGEFDSWTGRPSHPASSMRASAQNSDGCGPSTAAAAAGRWWVSRAVWGWASATGPAGHALCAPTPTVPTGAARALRQLPHADGGSHAPSGPGRLQLDRRARGQP